MTFETEAAIQRVVSHGTHRLRGSTIAIDIAMPKMEDGPDGNPGHGSPPMGHPGPAGQMSMDGMHAPGGMQPGMAVGHPAHHPAMDMQMGGFHAGLPNLMAQRV